MGTPLEQEWKKGGAEMLILSLVEDQARHGYDVAKLIERRSECRLRFHVSSLYSLLYRLENRGWIQGRWLFIDAVRPAATEEAGQIESLLDLYFGAVSGSGVWTLEAVQSWLCDAGLNCLSPIAMRLVPCWKMLVGMKNF